MVEKYNDGEHVRSVNDLFHYHLARLEGFCGAIVTRLCEGEFGVTRREWRFIALLNMLGETTPKQLAAEASLDRGCTSKTLAALEEKGLVVRRTSESDLRSQHVSLSESGRLLYDDLFTAIEEVNRDILAAVSPELGAQMLSSLTQLEVQARRVLEGVASRAQADRRHGGSRRRWERRDTVPADAQAPRWLQP